MIIEMTFSIQKVKQALDTESEELPSDIRRIASVLTIDLSATSNKYKDVKVVFLKNKLKKAYDDAISKGSDEVVVVYESPSDEDWEEYGYVRQGDLMVRKDSVEI